jgi:hypothetical protein
MTCLFLTLFVLVLTPLLVFANDDDYNVIMTQGSILEAGKTLQTQDGTCALTLRRDGNLISKRRGPYWPKPGNSNPIPPMTISWTSGLVGMGADYYAKLTPKGNLQVLQRGGNDIDADTVVFTTHVYGASTPKATHKLVFTEKCALRIMRQEEDQDYVTHVWTNIHEWLDNFSAQDFPGVDNVLQKGEFFSYPGQNFGTACGDTYCVKVPFSLHLQHDCNLVTVVGHDYGDSTAVVWSAGAARKNVSECYLLVDSNDVALYEGSFNPKRPVNKTPPGKYWSVPDSFFDMDVTPGISTFQILLDKNGEMMEDWD